MCKSVEGQWSVRVNEIDALLERERETDRENESDFDSISRTDHTNAQMNSALMSMERRLTHGQATDHTRWWATTGQARLTRRTILGID